MMEQLRIGIDLGGTKTEVIVLSPSGDALFRKRVSTTAFDYPAAIKTIVSLVHEAENEVKAPCSVGIGTPGALSPHTGLIKNSNSTWLNGQPFQADIELALERPVRLANDANCFTLSEAVDGAGKDARVVFGVILGTGTGGGIVVDKMVLPGANAIAGEWGHNPLPWPDRHELPGPLCYCGKSACIETFLSGPALVRDHASRDRTGNTVTTAEQIVQLADLGDNAALLTLDIYERRLAKSLAMVINIIDPEIIVLGGGLSNIQRLYHNIPDLWQDYIFSDFTDTKLVAPAFGDSSGVRGAAWLWGSDDMITSPRQRR